MLHVIIFLAVLVGINAQFVNFTHCDFDDVNEMTTGSNFSIEVSNCSNPNKCPLYRGKAHDIRLCFVCSNPSSVSVIMSVFGVFSVFTVPYGRPHEVCETAYLSNGTTCAMTEGMRADHEYCFETKFPVLPWYPKVELNVKFLITDVENNENIACCKVPVSIVDLEEY